jgi:hypothetical protein
MNKVLTASVIIIVAALGYLAYKDFTSIKGCYIATIDKDVYILNLASQKGEQVAGTLSFKNYQMDSTNGTFNGTYAAGILLGDYAFQAEGTNQAVKVVFKKDGGAFIRGTGQGNMTSLKDVVYDAKAPRSVFRKGKCL